VIPRPEKCQIGTHQPYYSRYSATQRYSDSLSGCGSNTQPSNWEANTLALRYRRPHLNHRLQCLGVRWCYNVPLGRCWGTNDRRKRIKLALIIYCDFMQSLSHQISEEGQYKWRTTGALKLASLRSNIISFFVQKTFDWDSTE